MHSDVDGEIRGRTPAQITLEANALRVMACVPRNSGWLEVMVLGLTCGNASRHASEACL
jgi:hypothetical protein